MTETCGRCGRRLKNPVFREIGYGRTCAAKVTALKWSITTQERNALVETHLGCIWWTINKKWSAGTDRVPGRPGRIWLSDLRGGWLKCLNSKPCAA